MRIMVLGQELLAESKLTAASLKNNRSISGVSAVAPKSRGMPIPKPP
jgi:hypothetical protein